MCNFLLSLAGHSSLLLKWETAYVEIGLNKFFHTSAQMDISCIKCVFGENWKANSQNSQPTQFLIYFKNLLPIKLITKYCIWVICIQFSVAMETVNPKIWCSSRFQNGMLYFITEHALIIYVQYIKGSKRKTSYLLEKLFENDLVHFVSNSIFKRLKFDYSSSETVSN